LKLAQGAVRIRDELGIPIVAFDLAGAENGFPAKDHRRAFNMPMNTFWRKLSMRVKRMAHLHLSGDYRSARRPDWAGYYLFYADKIQDETIEDRAGTSKHFVNILPATGLRLKSA